MTAIHLSTAEHAPAGHDAQAELRAQIWAERMRMLTMHVPTVMLMAVGFALVLGCVLHGQVEPAKVWWWFGVRLAVVVARVVQARLFLQRATNRADPAWYWSFLVLVVADGALWGAAWWWLVPDRKSGV